MKSALPEILVGDHRRIQGLCGELKRETQRGGIASEEVCFRIFRNLKALIMAHAKAEEYALYALFDLDKKCRSLTLQHFSLEGYEEHDLMDKLLKEMGQGEEVNPHWQAQLTVLSDLFERHIVKEEKEFIPAARGTLALEELVNLGVMYVNERDQIFVKRSGMTLQAAGLAAAPAFPLVLPSQAQMITRH